MRLIDADALIKTLNENKIEFNSDINYFIMSAPSVNQWIPCSEGLPDIGEHHVSLPCIVYCSNGAYGFSELMENLFGQVGWSCERDDEYHEPLGEVVAWMPLHLFDAWKASSAQEQKGEENA